MKVSLDAEALRQAVFVRNLSAIETKTAFITLFLAGIKFAVVVKFKESFLKSHQFKIVLTSIKNKDTWLSCGTWATILPIFKKNRFDDKKLHSTIKAYLKIPLIF